MSNTDSRWSTTADYPDYEFDYYIVLLLLLLLGYLKDSNAAAHSVDTGIS